MTDKSKGQVRAEYNRAVFDVAILVDAIQQHLETGKSQNEETGLDWCAVGDMEEIRRQLKQTLAFVANYWGTGDEEEADRIIEQTLEEARTA